TDNRDKAAGNAVDNGRVRLQLATPKRSEGGLATPKQSEGGPDLYSETEYPRAAGWSPLRALTDGRWLTITAGDATELYDLQNDPQERHNGAGGSPSIAHAMRARIETIAAAAKQTPPSTMNQETGERLRALGYV